jgi:hypothetical protein
MYVLFLLFLLATRTSPAQSAGTGSITGTITDPSNAAIAGASVEIQNTDTGVLRTVTTDDDGLFTAPFLQPGHYDVNASKDGFAVVSQKNVLLQVGSKLTLDFSLPLKTTTAIVDVTSQAPVIEPEKTDISQTVSETLAGGLPLNGRRWENFALLTPGVTTDGSHGLMSYHGISGLFNNSQVDGTSNQQAFFSEDRGRTSVGYTYSLDAIQEFQVVSNSYSAEFGQAAGGQVNAVTKSGGNNVHGDLFYYLRYPSLNALDPFSKASSLSHNQVPTQSEHQRQQFGGSVGGPIKRDKLFYFLNYDGQRRSFPIIYTGPSTTASTAAANTSSCNTIVPVVKGLTSAQCTTAIDDILNNIGPQPRTGNQDIYLAKLDYQLNPSNRLSASFNFMNWKAPNDYSTSPTFSAGSDSQNGSYGTHERFLVAKWTSVLSPTIVNDFRFQWSRDFEFYSANFSGPSVSLGSLFGYGMPNALPRPAFPDEHRLEFADSMSWIHNRHTIKFGGDISPIHELLINLFQGGGIYSYFYSDSTPVFTLQNWIADVYNLPLTTDTSAAQLGRHYNTFTQAEDPITGIGKDDFYDTDYAAFVEDSWKPRSNLTLNLGLRYDIQAIPQPPHPNMLSSLATFATSKINIDKADIAPRIGVAWQTSPNTVVRGAYGIFYGKTTNSLFYDTRVENGVYQLTYGCNAAFTSSTTAPGAISSCAPVFPNIIFPALGPALEAPFSGAVVPKVTAESSLPTSALAFRGQQPDFLEPMVHEANVAVERQLPGKVSISGTYMYTRGQHLPVCDDINLAPSTSNITYTVLAGPFAPASTVTLPLFTARANAATGIISSCQSTVHSLYNAFVFTGKKQFSHGFELLANYTLSKSQDDGQVLGDTGTFNGSSDAPLNPFNQQAEWGASDFDQRQRFVTSFLWTPTVHSENSFVRHALNGFGFGGIVTISSPFPVNGLLSSAVKPCTGPGTSGLCGVNEGVTGAVEINASVSAGRTPNVAKNFFHGPTQIRDVDFRIYRDVPITEKYKFQFIIEAFNLFNHTFVTSVNTSAYAYLAGGTSSGGVTCATTNPCLVPQTSFLTPTATSNNLLGARQLQISGKFSF